MIDSDVLYGFRLRLFDHAREVGVVGGLPDLRGPPLDLLPLEGAWSSAPGSRCCDRASAGRPRMPNQRARSSSSASSPSPSPIRGSGPGASARPWPRSAGAASSSAPTASGGCCAATACPGGSAASRLVAGYAAPPEPERPTRARAPRRGRPPGRARGLRLLPRGPPVGHDGPGLAVHRDRPRHSATSGPSCTPRRSTRRAQHRRLARRVAADLAAAGWRLERVLTDNGSEFRISRVRRRRCASRRGPDLHPAGPARDQRRRRAGPAHHPRGVLAAVVRPQPGAQARRARSVTRALPRATTTRSAPTPDG